MFRTILSFELQKRLKKWSSLVYFILFLLLGFFLMWRASVGSGLLSRMTQAGQGNLYADAPFALYTLILLLSNFGIIITAAFFGDAACRDFMEDSHGLYFSYPIKKIGYLGGRFAGAYISALSVFSGAGIGAFLGCVLPFTNMEKIGPLSAFAYIQPYLVGVMPNLLTFGALFFTLALLSRKFRPVYAGLVIVIVSHLFAISLLRGESRVLAALIDPFGQIGMRGLTGYWSIAEKNRLLVPLEGVFLWNRLLWMTLGGGLLFLVFRRFQFSHRIESGVKKSAAMTAAGFEGDPAAVPGLNGLTVNMDFRFIANVKRAFATMLHEFQMFTKNMTFRIIFLLGIGLIVFIGLRNVGIIRGTQTFPVTSQLLDSTKVTLYLFMLLATSPSI